MRGKGLSYNLIIETATNLVKENGYGSFTMRELAAQMNVRAASLYKHISGIEEVNLEIGKNAAALLKQRLTDACAGKEREATVIAAGTAFRDFAKQEAQLYHAILAMPSLTQDDDTLDAAREGFAPLTNIVRQYDIPPEMAVHLARCYRSALHGFIAQQEAGYFTNSAVNVADSFRILLRNFVFLLNAAELGSLAGKSPEADHH